MQLKTSHLAAGLLALAVAPAGHAFNASPSLFPLAIPWAPCLPEEASIYAILGSRVSCARIPVPVDHLDPGLGTIDLGVMRVRASRAVERKGAIFVNFGGPGGSPMHNLPEMAADWVRADPSDEFEVRRKELVDHFDLIGVVPRGLRGGWTFECMPALFSSYEFIPVNTDDANMLKVETQAREAVRACNENPFYKYVNTEQNARDMEFVRLALGEPKLNFLGISYGTWLGAWYASLFPEHVGRMVFDSTMDVTRPFADAIHLNNEAEDEALARRVLRPLAARNDLYGMGSDVAALRQRIHAMHPLSRKTLAPLIATPASFIAAMRLDGWLASDGMSSRASLTRRVDATRFNENDVTDAAIRRAAGRLLPAMFATLSPQEYQLGKDGDSVHMATVCNDDVWPSGLAHWQAVARDNAASFPTSNGENAYVGMLCGQWGARAIRRPDLTRLAEAPPILMVQAEYDHSTPLSGARQMRDTFSNLYLVIARNLENHGVYSLSRTPCIERAVPLFFLEGTLPAQRTTSCVEEARNDLPQASPESLHTHTEFWRRFRIW